MLNPRDFELSPSGLYEPRRRVLTPKALCPLGVVAGGMSAAIVHSAWSLTNKLHSTLSNSNRTTAHSGGGNTALVNWGDTLTATNQKLYFELVITQVTFSFQLGINNGSSAITGNASDVNVNGAGININGVFFSVASVDHGTTLIASLAATDRLGIACDTSTLKFWARKNGGAWNSVVGGTQNPATGQGGVTVGYPAPFYSAIYFDAVDGDGVTGNFAPANWVDAAPSGFTEFGQ